MFVLSHLDEQQLWNILSKLNKDTQDKKMIYDEQVKTVKSSQIVYIKNYTSMEAKHQLHFYNQKYKKYKNILIYNTHHITESANNNIWHKNT